MNNLLYLAKIGEISLKKGNKKTFENQLIKNLKKMLNNNSKISIKAGRLYLSTNKEFKHISEMSLNRLTGITGWAEANATEKNISAITDLAKKIALEANKQGIKTFKIEARRSDKTFNLNSYQIASEVGGVIHEQNILTTNVHNPDIIIKIEIREQAFVYGIEKKGRRGLPTGTSGKGLLLLSGGIDSPVAGYKMIFRGMKIDCIYFHSYPYTSKEAQEKVEKLASIIAEYNLGTYLNIISFTDIQKKIKQTVPEPYMTLMMRMCMMKLATMTAKYINAQCLITGESLAQVASQTLENLHITNSSTDMLVCRPLIGIDKQEITEMAKEIGTYETSILPYPDCCVLFSPKHPALYTKYEDALEIYNKMDINELLLEAFKNREVKKISLTI